MPLAARFERWHRAGMPKRKDINVTAFDIVKQATEGAPKKKKAAPQKSAAKSKKSGIRKRS